MRRATSIVAAKTRTALALCALCALAVLLSACGGGGEEPTSAAPTPRGELVSIEQTALLTRAMIDDEVDRLPGMRQLIGDAPRCDVALHRIVYRTIAPDASPALASAAIATPIQCGSAYPLVVYHHGTNARRAFTMSDPGGTETLLNIAFFGAQGYVVVMPDDHGYGQSSLDWHPYLNVESGAAVSIDAIRAARAALTGQAVALSGKLFLWGYSEGGHSALSTQRVIERDHPGEFAITASAPTSGPYALDWMFAENLVRQTYGASVFAPMLLVGYQKAYRDLYANPSEVFQPPWSGWVEDLLPGTLGLSELVAQGYLPATLTGPGGLLTDAFVSAYQASATYPARRRIAQNDLRGWRPRAPTLLCGGRHDPVVPFFNSTATRDDFVARGADARAIDVEDDPLYKLLIELLQLAGAGEGDYHAGIVPPLCAAIIKKKFFDRML